MIKTDVKWLPSVISFEHSIRMDIFMKIWNIPQIVETGFLGPLEDILSQKCLEFHHLKQMGFFVILNGDYIFSYTFFWFPKIRYLISVSGIVYPGHTREISQLDRKFRIEVPFSMSRKLSCVYNMLVIYTLMPISVNPVHKLCIGKYPPMRYCEQGTGWYTVYFFQ